MRATPVMDKQSARLNKAAQQRRESNYIVDIYIQILFSAVVQANTWVFTSFNV